VPEGDTIFRAARTLHRALAGDTITRFDTRYAHLSVVDDQSPVAGRTVERVEARGKHLLIWMSGDLILRTHMRMSGSWHVYRPGEPWQRSRSRMRVLLATDRFVAVGFDVPDAEFLTAAAFARSAPVVSLGPDLLGGTFDRDEALRRFRMREDAEIGVALLDQRVMAGAGNVFKSEVLFLTGVNPWTRVADLADALLLAIIDASRELLRANVTPDSGDAIVTRPGGRRTTRYADPTARVWVSERGGRPCRRCGTPIEVRKQGDDARVTYWCPVCQPHTVTPRGATRR
jgi:endonuclease-8